MTPTTTPPTTPPTMNVTINGTTYRATDVHGWIRLSAPGHYDLWLR